VQEIEEFFAQTVRLSASATSYMISIISREPRELPWQPNLAKNQNCTNFNSLQEIEEFCARAVKACGVVEFKYAT